MKRVVLMGMRRSVSGVACAAVLSLGGSAAFAEDRNFPVERFRLATDRSGLLDVEDAIGLAPHEWNVSLWLGVADDPLVIYTESGGDRMRASRLVDTRLGGDIGAAYGLTRWAQLALSAPVILYQNRDSGSDAAVGGMLAPIGSTGLGALRLAVKLRLLRQSAHGVDVALIPAITFPTNTASAEYLGESSVSFAPELAIGRSFGRVRIGLDLGYRARARSTVANLIIDDELFAHAGLGVRVTPALVWAVTTSGAIAASGPLDHFNQDYAELVTGPTFQANRDLQLIAAGGIGIAEGYGTPDARVLLAARYDRVAEPKKAVVRPPPPPVDLDADDDGVLDTADHCIHEPGPADNQGCPDADADGDGLVDRLDKCPTEPEDKDGFEDGDGCPDLDDDGDSVPDLSDACPREAGPVDNHGCPDPDRDGDSIVDRLDTCPDEPGDIKNNGCKAKPLASITDGKIAIVETVYFKLDKAVIEKRSFKLLESVASVLSAHSGVRVRIEGHTDSQGNDAHNKDLSQRRAEAVRAFLVARGIDVARLDAVGFGEERPVGDNKTTKGRAANRRVEFVIVDASGVDVKSQTNGPDSDTMEPTR